MPLFGSNTATSVFSSQDEASPFRTIAVPIVGHHYDPSRYADNRVTTSRYSVFNFVFLNLWFQFKRFSNVYFALIAILQLVPAVSITRGIPTILVPLSFVLLVTAVKDAIEDYRRHRSDAIENSRLVDMFNYEKDEFEKVTWAQVPVGAIVRYSNRETVAADTILLHTSNASGLAFVQTANLDGETNLKTKRTPADLFSTRSLLRRLGGFKCNVACDIPNARLHKFQGTLLVNSSRYGPRRIALDATNLLLRGTVLRNTEWVVGVVVYAGRETKMQMNTIRPRFKVSQVMRSTNRLTIWMFSIQCLLCLAAAITSVVWELAAPMEAFLGPAMSSDPGPVIGIVVQRFFTFIILFTNFIPISLLVTSDVVKFLQSRLMEHDSAMFHEPTRVGLQVRSMDLNDELGSVEYVLADKTGTLTRNVMEFRKCSIAGVSYGLGTTEIGLRVLTARGLPIPAPPVLTSAEEAAARATPHVKFHDPNLQEALHDRHHSQHWNSVAFFMHMAVNHAVIAESAAPGTEEAARPASPLFGSSSVLSLSVDKLSASTRILVADHGAAPAAAERLPTESDLDRMSPVGLPSASVSDAPDVPAGRGRLRVQSVISDDINETNSYRHMPATTLPPGQVPTPTGSVQAVTPSGFSHIAAAATNVVYSGSSPDETTLVYAAAHFGFKFWSRSKSHVEILIAGVNHLVQVLHVFPFTPERRRSTIVVRDGHRTIVFCKGADSVILDRLAPDTEPHVLIATYNHIAAFAEEGLRTLVLAQAELSETAYSDWATRLSRAEMLVQGRDSAVALCLEELENNLRLQGVTAIEDKLQQGVPETVSALREAGIHVWMLTGDKVGTAVNIGVACALVTPDMKLFRLTTGDDADAPPDATGPASIGRLTKSGSDRANRLGMAAFKAGVSNSTQSFNTSSTGLSVNSDSNSNLTASTGSVNPGLNVSAGQLAGLNTTSAGILATATDVSVPRGLPPQQDSARSLISVGSASTVHLPPAVVSGARRVPAPFGLPDSIAVPGPLSPGPMSPGPMSPATRAASHGPGRLFADDSSRSLVSSVPTTVQTESMISSIWQGFAADDPSRKFGKMPQAAIEDRMIKLLGDLRDWRGQGKTAALAVDTGCLQAIVAYQLGGKFLELARMCSAVVCARMTPDQKGQVVSLVQRHLGATTLAIGDGANDVNMIQTANIGVGIVGTEGSQAANNADYSIAQFRYLARLLLVHGRWSARRVGLVVMYMFYKNALLVLPQFFFGVVSMFSGQNFYYEWVYQLHNVAYTALPILVLGVLDQDIAANMCLEHPALYGDARRRKEFFNTALFWRWVAEAVWQAFAVFSINTAMLGYMQPSAEGRDIGLWAVGLAIHFSVMLVANVQILSVTRSFSAMVAAAQLVSFGLWFISVSIFSNFVIVSSDLLGVLVSLLSLPTFWFSAVLATVVALLPHWIGGAWRHLFLPSESALLRRQVRGFSRGPSRVGPSRGASLAVTSSTVQDD